MLNECLSNEAARTAVERLDAAFLANFDLTESERKVLESPTPGSLAELGVHPMLAMWGAVMRNPDMAAVMSAGQYFVDHPSYREGR
ncbi:hypothetical protein AU184_08755 [Mycolicibacterium novocastrense]|nr:hypothetical protein AU184_08755 [Mycolicibacterium novocastrense]KUH71355.1 hypothetical protein AU183_06125 [Mycolicibacterium novocastrense]KUH74419.1 hypothetical protein AU072_17540 [Mycolicibacterium novocastrense]